MGSEKEKRRRGRKNDAPNASKKQRTSHSGSSVGSKENGSATGYKSHSSLLITSSEETSMWFDFGKNIPGRDDTVFTVETPPPQSDSKNAALVAKYRNLADQIYRSEISLTDSEGKPSSDERWVENTMRKGTLKDRIAATSVLVSTDPVHKLSTLDSLLNMAGCTDAGQSNSRVAQMAAEALEDLFLNTLLPPDRKLWRLDQRPLAMYEASASSKKTLSPRVLLLWRFEEMLKERYQSFLNSYLVVTLREGMELSKIFALRAAGTMLKSAPEGETQLLNMMVNKLGDPGKKIAAAAGHELRRVLEHHESMQEIVAREVLQLAHRPQLSSRALYNCIVFLNQLHLYKEPEDSNTDIVPLSVLLVNMYFRMFDVAVNKQSDEKSGTKSRLLSALLTGINRAHPYLPNKDQGLDDHMDSLYNVTYTAPPSASTQALMLLFLVAVGNVTEVNLDEAKVKKQSRFYRAVYTKLSIPSFLSGGKHLTMFFNLLYKTMKNDTDSERVLAFAKRLMCTTFHAGPPVAAASLFLLNEIMKTHRIIAMCLSETPSSSNSQLCLDPTKREPRAALVRDGEQDQLGSTKEIPPMWELCLLSNHFHPSVGKFSSSLGDIHYSGDPLRDFALAPFLDKFSYKNPKAQKRNTLSVAKRRIEAQRKQPVNEPAFLRQQNVDDADKFFHDFFTAKARRDKATGLSKENGKEEDVTEAEDEAFVMLEGRQIENVFEDDASTDPEEEEYADKLAMDIIREASGQEHFDEEDPDMDDWNDIAGDSSSDGSSIDDEIGSVDDEDEPDVTPIDQDAFMDETDSDDNLEAELFLDSDDDSDASSASPEEDTMRLMSKETQQKVEKNVFLDVDDYNRVIKQGYEDKQSSTNKQSETGDMTQTKRKKKTR